MGNFLGGSAYAMARQIAEGFMLVSQTTLRRLTRHDLTQLQLEIQKILTDERANQPAPDDVKALQARNRKISRISNASQVIQGRLSGR